MSASLAVSVTFPSLCTAKDTLLCYTVSQGGHTGSISELLHVLQQATVGPKNRPYHVQFRLRLHTQGKISVQIWLNAFKARANICGVCKQIRSYKVLSSF